MNRVKVVCVLCFVAFGIVMLFADNPMLPVVESYSTGPPPGHTAGPGEGTCTECHFDNGGPGIFTITAPPNYVPGQTYQIQVQHATTDMTRLRWGFQMTALSGDTTMAGTFTDTSGFTQIDFGNSRFYIEHTETGTFPGTTGGANWSFDWTAPATDVGAVTFYASGNEADNDSTFDGDQIYTTSTVTQPAGSPTPTNTATATATNTPTPTPTCYTVTNLSQAEEVPPTGSAGTGVGTVSINAAQTQITVTLSWTGLTSNAIAADIHGPAAAGANAGIVFGMSGVPNSPSGSIATQSFPISPAELTQFQNGLFYWNIHTTNFGGGEIRGQILPGPCLPSPTPTNTPTGTATNTPTNTATATATNTPTPGGASISGTITYGNSITAVPPAPRFIRNVSVESTAGTPPVGPVITGTPGTYTLTGFGSGSYTIKPTKAGGPNGAILSADASRVAQGSSGLIPFVSMNQKFAADTSGNGSIASADAARIAQFATGLTPTAPSFVGQWRFFTADLPGPVSGPLPTPPYNDSRSYTDPIGVQTGQDYIGILIGDVTGNWNPATHPRPAQGPERSTSVVAPRLVTPADNEVIIPVSVSGAVNKEITAYQFDLRYDPTVIQPQVEPVDLAGTVSRGLWAVANPNEPGLLRVAVYGVYPIGENGLLLNLRFTAVGAPGMVSPLTFEDMIFNEGYPETFVTDGWIELSAALLN